MGTLTRFVRAIAELPGFHAVFKKRLNLSSLGLWWTQPRSENAGNFTPKKLCLHYELDISDIRINEDIASFFNRRSNSIDNNFLDIHMSIVCIHTPFLDNELKARIKSHTRKQLSLKNSIRSTTVADIHMSTQRQRNHTTSSFNGYWKYLCQNDR